MSNPNDFLGWTLHAIKPVNIVTWPQRNFVKTIPAGSIIGTIFSWTPDPDNANNVYFQLTEYQGSSGGGFVKNDPTAMWGDKSDIFNQTTVVQAPGFFQQAANAASQTGANLLGGIIKQVAPWLLGLYLIHELLKSSSKE